MSNPTEPPINQWKTLDKDLGRVLQMEQAIGFVARPLVALGIALVFIVVTTLDRHLSCRQYTKCADRGYCRRFRRLYGAEHRRQ